MRRIHGAALAAAILTLLPLASIAGPPDETDGDGIPDMIDKCTHDSRNAISTCDTDCDGYGNVCDADFSQDNLVTSGDFSSFFVPAFKSGVPSPTGTDMNCDGLMTSGDFGSFFVPKFKGALGGAVPGPSGLACAGQPSCGC